MKYALHITTLLLAAGGLMLTTACNESTPNFRIGISQCSHDDWRQQMNREMQREASFHKNIQLDIRTAYDNNDRQIRQIDSLIDKGIDLLVVSPNEERPLTSAVEKAIKHGIPVVVVDRKIASNNYTAYVGADNRAIGKDIGAYVIKSLDGNGRVAELTGRLASTAASERHQGFRQALQKAPGIQVVAQAEVGWKGTRVKQQVDSLLQTVKQLPQIVLAPNDRTGVRIHQALLQLGHPEIKVIGVDGLNNKGGGLDNVEQGQLMATFVYPTGGDKVIQTALHILKKEPYQRENLLQSAVINAATVRIFRMQSDQVKFREQRIDELGSQMDRFLSRYSMQNMLLLACIVIIVLIGIMLGIGIRFYYITIRRNEELAQQKHKLEEQRDQLVQMAKEVKDSTQSKLTFFTEVSHDLRTPLTLVTAPVEQLLSSTGLTEEQKNLLQVVHTNANILLRLVGQMLDFRKYEDGQLKLNPVCQQLDTSLKQWCEPFKALAHKKLIRYTITCQPTTVHDGWMGWVDGTKMESVVYNLLSNAFKYTPEGGKVNVTARLTDNAEQGRLFTIVVEDTGQGIEHDKLPHIFDRFYQADVSHDGSGIGLATVKAFVELHGGTVRADSTPGTGTRFIVSVPCDERFTLKQQPHEAAPTIGSAEAMNKMQTELQRPEPLPMPTNNKANKTDADRPTVLVIDDNEDIRSYIKLLLGNDYVVFEAADGQEGLTKARQSIPDAVVCDVMMPVMNGWECCRRLKDEWQTSHIPVMMLTACTLNDQRMVSFDCGADAYIDKPFSPEVFRVRLRNLIANRRRLQLAFGDRTSIAKADVSDIDKSFAERFSTMVEQNIKNPDFTVEDMATKMGIGRTQLYRKMKSLTGLSPIELLRVARLKKAAELLHRTDMSVSQVTYETGFSSPSYFTKCFKEYFGVNPKEY